MDFSCNTCMCSNLRTCIYYSFVTCIHYECRTCMYYIYTTRMHRVLIHACVITTFYAFTIALSISQGLIVQPLGTIAVRSRARCFVIVANRENREAARGERQATDSNETSSNSQARARARAMRSGSKMLKIMITCSSAGVHAFRTNVSA